MNSVPPSLRSLALADITPEDVDWMIREGETLVELKADIPKDGIGPTISSFANTLGGWLVLGVEDKDRSVVGWMPNGRADIVDYLRQRLREEVDPMPPFAAREMEIRGGQVGVVRIYESMDTPHIIRRTGAVYLREPGGKRPIREHGELIELARRGEDAEARARARLHEMPVVSEVLRTPDTGRVENETRAVRWIARAAPLTVSPVTRDWPLTRRAADWCSDYVDCALRHRAPYERVGPRIDPYGRAVVAYVDQDVSIGTRDRSLLVADAGGVFGAELDKGIEIGDRPSILVEQMLGESIKPLARALAAILTEAEAWGRAVVDLWCLFPGDEPIAGPHRQPFARHLHAAGEITTPATEGDVDALASAWHRELQRSIGIVKFEDE
ncbi:MAG TPA: ATP-binding protein [Solirubrobacterales bacterium]|nr:ATP-binding protein [Solirubrobacterales bacterium]